MIQMTNQTPKMVTKWLSFEPVHARIKGAHTLACNMHVLFHSLTQTHSSQRAFQYD